MVTLVKHVVKVQEGLWSCFKKTRNNRDCWFEKGNKRQFLLKSDIVLIRQTAQTLILRGGGVSLSHGVTLILLLPPS